ncbi:MAG TPA: AIR synthase-related protein, partial [Candidatus Polarisedimenticolia bacterium]|nr:AIR synthase-related protein [Candidatus Polarisedimenticolia bacterium]
LGHVAEMVQAAGAGVSVDAARLPVLEGAEALADKGHWSGGMRRNRRWVEATLGDRLSIGPGLAPGLAGLLFESETSGGLLFATPPAAASRVREGFRARGEPCWEVGEVTREVGIRVA